MSSDTPAAFLPLTRSTSLLEFFERDYLRERPLEQNTVSGYRIHLRRFEHWLRRAATIADLTRETVNNYLAAVGVGYSDNTARGAKCVLRALWWFAVQLDPSMEKPAELMKVKKWRPPAPETPIWGREEVQRLLTEAAKLKGRFKGKTIRRADYWRAYILVAYETGLRHGMLARIASADISDQEIIARDQQRRPLRVTISIRTRQAIESLDPATRPLVFDVVERRYFFHALKRLIASAGLNGRGKDLRFAGERAERVFPEPELQAEPEPVRTPKPAEPVQPVEPRSLFDKHRLPTNESTKPAGIEPRRARPARTPIVPKWRKFETEPGEAQSLYHYYAKTYRPRKLLGKTPRTLEMYLVTIDRFGDYLQRTPTLDDLTEEALCGFLEYRFAQGRAHHTVDKEGDKLKAIANYAARKRHIPEFLDIPQINPAEILPTCWRREQVEQLFRACREARGQFGTAPRNVWWVAFHALCLSTGERTEAMLSLEWSMLQGSTLSVPASIRKGKRKAARYRLPPSVLEELEQLRRYTAGKIFAAPWKDVTTSFYGHYTQLLKSAGLPSTRRFKPQCLRRTFASFLEAGGGDATEALGHSDRSVTRESYLDTSITLAGKEAPSAIVWRELGMAARPLAITHDKTSEGAA